MFLNISLILPLMGINIWELLPKKEIEIEPTPFIAIRIKEGAAKTKTKSNDTAIKNFCSSLASIFKRVILQSQFWGLMSRRLFGKMAGI